MAEIDDVLAESRGTYLNDPSGNKYTDAVMLPQVRSAYNFLQTALQNNGLQIVSEEYIAIIDAGDDGLDPLPPDLVIPIKMEERTPNTTEEFRPMFLRYNITKEASGPYLEEWAWRADRIYVKAATVDREVRLYYRRSFPVAKTTDTFLFAKAAQYLAAKSAALAFMFIDQSTELAQVANDIAEQELEELLNMSVKVKQAIPVRCKPYLPFRTR